MTRSETAHSEGQINLAYDPFLALPVEIEHPMYDGSTGYTTFTYTSDSERVLKKTESDEYITTTLYLADGGVTAISWVSANITDSLIGYAAEIENRGILHISSSALQSNPLYRGDNFLNMTYRASWQSGIPRRFPGKIRLPNWNTFLWRLRFR